jgi:hypothetical protein
VAKMPKAERHQHLLRAKIKPEEWVTTEQTVLTIIFFLCFFYIYLSCALSCAGCCGFVFCFVFFGLPWFFLF